MTLSSAAVCTQDRRQLQSAFAIAARRAHALGRPVLAAVVLSAHALDPLTVYARSEGLADTRAFWSSPGDELRFAGIDAAWTCEGQPAQAARDWRELAGNAVIDASDSPAAAEPLLLAGFAFDPARPATPAWAGYPSGLTFLPRLLVTAGDGATQVRANALMGPSADVEAEVRRTIELWTRLQGGAASEAPAVAPVIVEELMPAERWQAIVAGAMVDLQRVGLEKVVLARAARVRSAAQFAIESILRSLRTSYPTCFVFAFGRGDRSFVGATPEQLVSLRSGRINAVSLAGTIARGHHIAEDEALAARLAGSAKEQKEHSIVVRAMRESLSRAGAHTIGVGPPTILKLPNVQHLQTRLTAAPAAGSGVLDLVEHLHPTPAVGGYPRDPALRMIREREELDRGWYAGPVGWVDAAGEGEFAVALRSALVHGSDALLFAGCGIVPGSDPASEYAESCLKLRPMLAALNAGGSGQEGRRR